MSTRRAPVTIETPQDLLPELADVRSRVAELDAELMAEVARRRRLVVRGLHLGMSRARIAEELGVDGAEVVRIARPR